MKPLILNLRMDVGSVLSCADIVETIFKHLKAKDLCSCASVCSLWAVLSQKEIQRRKGIESFFQVMRNEDNPIIQLERFESELKEQLQNTNIKPAFCIAFATTAFLMFFEPLFKHHFDGTQQPRKRRKTCYWDYFDTAFKITLQKHLPKTCRISLYLQECVVFYRGDSQSDVNVASFPGICGYLFPDFPGGELNFYKRKESVGQILKHIIKNGHNIKGTLNIVESTFMESFQIALTKLRHKHNAFASGIIMPAQLASSYIPVFEGPNVQVFRYAIQENDVHFDAKMEQWKYKMKEEKGFTGNTIAFMFSIQPPVGDIVCNSYKKVFPGVPLYGMMRYDDFRFGQNKNFDHGLLRSSLLESGLMYQIMFMFVTFNA